MSKKLPKNVYPNGHKPNDFIAFGPPATADGQFENTKIADLGCFTQDGKDSNKAYHAAVVKSKINKFWFAYFEWGRTGNSSTFQFIECENEEEAQQEYEKQLHSKNDKRGEWITVAGHKVLRAKAGKDCYLVRPAAKRDTGLPDAKRIVHDEGIIKKSTKKTIKKKAFSFDAETIKLMRDMNAGTVSYTRAAIEGGHIPTLETIDKVRDLLSEAQVRVGKIGSHNIADQARDRDLREITNIVYSLVPKVKKVGSPESEWILTSGNIQQWRFDCDAFENALHAIDTGEEVETDPFEGHNIQMKHMTEDTLEGDFIKSWLPGASANRHSHVGNMKIHNMWAFRHVENFNKFREKIKDIKADSTSEKASFQPKSRKDISKEDVKIYNSSNVAMLLHGTRSVNVPGIIREGLRLPRQLVGVVITGKMFGEGVYFATDWRKSAGYTSLPNSYWSNGSGGVKGRKAFMFISDVALGNGYIAPGPYGYLSPPSGFHSVLGKAGISKVVNDEWIVYNTYQVNLKYLVEFSCSR